jgi:hypothetical protein
MNTIGASNPIAISVNMRRRLMMAYPALVSLEFFGAGDGDVSSCISQHYPTAADIAAF